MIRAGSASPVVAQGIALHAARARQAVARRWILIDSLLLLVLVYDLWSSCGCGTAAAAVTRAAESVAALVLVAALGTHAARARAPPPGRAALTGAQRRLLALHAEPTCEPEKPPPSPPPPPAPLDVSLQSAVLSPRPPASPPGLSLHASMFSPPSPSSPLSPARSSPDASDRFLGDRDSFATYRKEAPSPPPPYRVSPRQTAAAPAHVSLHLPQHCLNMRTWIHATIVSRVAEELERERHALVTNTPGASRSAGALRRYLEVAGYKPHAHYVAARIRELSQGACLGAYRWEGGGADWDNDKPTDAEIIMHLFSVYMAGSMGGAAGGALVKRSRRPPHYDLRHHNTTIQIPGGRNNVLQCALVWVCVCRRGATHTLTHALNLDWVLDADEHEHD